MTPLELTPAQKQIAKDPHRFRAVNCGRRFGKTTLSAWEMLGFAAAYKDARVPYYAPTRDDARDIIWKMLQEVGKDLILDKNEQRLELVIRNRFGGTSLIVLYGWEAVQERKKGVGVRNNFIVLDEVAKYREFWPGWQEVLRPTLTDLKGSALFISTPNGFNHFYDLCNLESVGLDGGPGDSDYKYFHFTSYDNPFMDPEEIKKAQRELTEDRFAQEYMADFRKMEGLVYKEFSRDKHLIRGRFDPKDFYIKRKLVGVDFGTRNPAAVLTIYETEDGQYIVGDEWYKREQTDAQTADYAAALEGNEYYPDPASASGVLELERKKVNVREVLKNTDSIRHGITVVRELFKSNRLYIHESCINLIAELETYRYPESKPGKEDDEKPVKENDHALDALRYVLMMVEARKGKGGTHIHRPRFDGYNKRGL